MRGNTSPSKFQVPVGIPIVSFYNILIPIINATDGSRKLP